MAKYVALLRAVNVGGTGKLVMKELRELCEKAGFSSVATYIQSGNVVFESKLAEAQVKSRLEKALATKMGKPVAVFVRSAAQLAALLECNPFPEAVPSRVLVWFLDSVPGKGVLSKLVIPGREQVKLVGRELFVHYPDGVGRSKLKLPAALLVTGRNLRTVAQIVGMARAE